MSRSPLALGTVQFGLNYGIANTHGQSSFEEVCTILRTAFDGGIDTLDTAAAYGESENVLGRALEKTGLAGKMKIVSKIAPLPAEASGAEAEKFIRTSFENSLKNLKSDSLHALLFHREKDLEYFDILREFQADGRVQYIGCSLDGSIPQRADELTAVQVPSNVFDRRFLSFIREAGSGDCLVFVRSVYLQGLLLMPEEKIPASLAKLIPYRRSLNKLAAEYGISMAELCIRYLISFPEIDGVLTGVETAGQLSDNLKLASRGGLPDELLAEIMQLIPDLPEELIRPCLWK